MNENAETRATIVCILGFWIISLVTAFCGPWSSVTKIPVTIISSLASIASIISLVLRNDFLSRGIAMTYMSYVLALTECKLLEYYFGGLKKYQLIIIIITLAISQLLAYRLFRKNIGEGERKKCGGSAVIVPTASFGVLLAIGAIWRQNLRSGNISSESAYMVLVCITFFLMIVFAFCGIGYIETYRMTKGDGSN